MFAQKHDLKQLGFYSTFAEQLNHQHPPYILAHQIRWNIFEETFRKHYNLAMGASAKPIRLMVGLLALKHIRNLSDESVMEQSVSAVIVHSGFSFFSIGTNFLRFYPQFRQKKLSNHTATYGIIVVLVHQQKTSVSTVILKSINSDG